MRNIFLFLMLFLFSCNEHKIKVIVDEYSKGKPRIIDYFDNEKDAASPPIVLVRNGVGNANKPISFDEERYYENGKIHSKGRYTKGVTAGLWEYFYETGVIQSKCYYENGFEKDTVHCYDSSGELKRLLIETDTIKRYWHGAEYFENGAKAIDFNLLNDNLDNWIIDGNWIQLYQNGQKQFQAVMRNNWTVGKWQKWNDKGDLIKEDSTPINITF